MKRTTFIIAILTAYFIIVWGFSTNSTNPVTFPLRPKKNSETETSRNLSIHNSDDNKSPLITLDDTITHSTEYNYKEYDDDVYKEEQQIQSPSIHLGTSEYNNVTQEWNKSNASPVIDDFSGSKVELLHTLAGVPNMEKFSGEPSEMTDMLKSHITPIFLKKIQYDDLNNEENQQNRNDDDLDNMQVYTDREDNDSVKDHSTSGKTRSTTTSSTSVQMKSHNYPKYTINEMISNYNEYEEPTTPKRKRRKKKKRKNHMDYHNHQSPPTSANIYQANFQQHQQSYHGIPYGEQSDHRQYQPAPIYIPARQQNNYNQYSMDYPAHHNYQHQPNHRSRYPASRPQYYYPPHKASFTKMLFNKLLQSIKGKSEAFLSIFKDKPCYPPKY